MLVRGALPWLLVLACTAGGAVRAQDAPGEPESPPAAEEPLSPDEDLVPPDDLEVGGAEAEPGEGGADLPPDDLGGFDEGLMEPEPAPAAPEPAPVVAAPLPPPERTSSELWTAGAVAGGACAGLSAGMALLTVVAHPLVVGLLALNVFAPLVVVPCGCATLIIQQTLLGGALYACGVGAPAPVVASVVATTVGAASQLAVTDPWWPLAAAALGGLPGIALALGAAVGVAAGVGIAVSANHFDTAWALSGQPEPVYLELEPAITGGLIALAFGVLGLVAVPVAGLGALGAGLGVAVSTEPAATSSEAASAAPAGAPTARTLAPASPALDDGERQVRF